MAVLMTMMMITRMITPLRGIICLKFQVCDHGVGKGEKIVLKQSHKISRIGLINMSPAWVYNQKGLQGPGGQRG